MDHIMVFLDTNTPLHYRWIGEIDWPEVFGAKRVDLVVVPVVVRELDRLKVYGTPKMRKRAQGVLAKLEPLLAEGRPVEIRAGVSVRYEPLEPREAMFQSPQLTKDLSDDWLIAVVIQWRKANPGTSVHLVTHDVGLRLKAQAMGVPARGLPDGLKLAEEPDPVEEENRELKRQLAEAQSRRPVLTLRFKDLGVSHATYRIERHAALSDEEIAARVRAARRKHPQKKLPEKRSGVNFSVSAISGDIEARWIPDYNKKLDAYYAEVEQYVRQQHEFESTLRRGLRLELEVVNDGTSPADEINLTLRLPDAITALTKEALAGGPKAPKPPPPPASLFLPQTFGGTGYDPTVRPVVAGNVSGPRIATDLRSVSFSIRRVLHGVPVGLESIAVIFSSWDTVRSFGIEYEIRSASLPHPTLGRLDVIIEKPPPVNIATESSSSGGEPELSDSL